MLGLVFLKYISDCFEKRYNELVEEGEGFEEDRDEYTAEHVFWVPQEARWQDIASKAHSPEIGQVIDHALEVISKENPRLKKVMLGELFSNRFSETLNRYVNGLLTNEEVIQELLKLAQEMMDAEQQGNDLGLSNEEKTFYDALTRPQAVKDFYSNAFLTSNSRITKLKRNMKNSLMNLYDKILLRKRAVIETVNDELKNICQIEHIRQRSVDNFVTNLIAGIIAYNLLPKKLGMDIEIIDESRIIA